MTGCSQCQAAMINGVYCHEAGCPEAWRDYHVDCSECGCEFKPNARHQTVCIDCQIESVDIGGY